MLWPVYLLGNFQYGGVAWVAASHITKNTSVSQRLILVYNTRNIPLQWHKNGRDGVSKHQLHDCLLSRLFRRRSKNISKLRVTGLCVGNSPMTDEFPHKGPVTRKMFPFDDVIMWKLSIIGPMLGNHRSSVESPYKGLATRKAFWCHCVMVQAYCWHNSAGLCVWGRVWADIRRVDVGSGHMIERVISENYTSHMISSCCNTSMQTCYQA